MLMVTCTTTLSSLAREAAASLLKFSGYFDMHPNEIEVWLDCVVDTSSAATLDMLMRTVVVLVLRRILIRSAGVPVKP